MANEITISSSVKCINGNVSYIGKSYATTFTQTTARAGSFTADIGTTEETLTTALADIAPGFIRLTNLDTVNFVEVGFSTGVYGMRLSANNGVAMFQLKSGATVYCKADTTACKIQVEAINA